MKTGAKIFIGVGVAGAAALGYYFYKKNVAAQLQPIDQGTPNEIAQQEKKVTEMLTNPTAPPPIETLPAILQEILKPVNAVSTQAPVSVPVNVPVAQIAPVQSLPVQSLPVLKPVQVKTYVEPVYTVPTVYEAVPNTTIQQKPHLAGLIL